MKTIKTNLILLICWSLIICACGKQKPEKYILGRWELESIETGSKKDWVSVMSDFVLDVSYFKEITFYSNQTVYFNYINSDVRLGTYEFKDSDIDVIEIRHAMIYDTINSYNFNFSLWEYRIEKLTRNSVILVTNGDPVGNDKIKDLRLKFKKTGEFK